MARKRKIKLTVKSFKSFLLGHGAYTAYNNGLKTRKDNFLGDKNTIDDIVSKNNFDKAEVLYSSFVWSETKEGIEYWVGIQIKMEEYFK